MSVANNVTKKELVDIIKGIKGATPVTIVTDTVPKVKKSCPIPDVHKVATINGFINFVYENSVNRVLEKAGENPDFVTNERAWGTHESLAIIENHGKYYLQMKVEKTIESDMFTGGTRLTEEEKELVKQHLYAHNSTTPVVVRTFSIDNIRRITMKGETYQIV